MCHLAAPRPQEHTHLVGSYKTTFLPLDVPVTSPLFPIVPSLYLRPALHMGSKKPPPQFSLKEPRAPEPVPPVIWTLLSYQLLGSGGVNRNGQISATFPVAQKYIAISHSFRGPQTF